MQTIINRLKEKSTWVTLLGLVAVVVDITTLQVDALAAAGVAIMTAVGVFTKEAGSEDA